MASIIASIKENAKILETKKNIQKPNLLHVDMVLKNLISAKTSVIGKSIGKIWIDTERIVGENYETVDLLGKMGIIPIRHNHPDGGCVYTGYYVETNRDGTLIRPLNLSVLDSLEIDLLDLS